MINSCVTETLDQSIRVDIIFGDEDHAGLRGRNTGSLDSAKCAGTPTISIPQSTAAAGTSTVSASQSFTTAPAAQAVISSTSWPKDIRMQAFIADSLQIFPDLKYSESHRCSSNLRRRRNMRTDWIPQERSYAVISGAAKQARENHQQARQPFHSHIKPDCARSKVNQWLSITCVYGFR